MWELFNRTASPGGGHEAQKGQTMTSTDQTSQTTITDESVSYAKVSPEDVHGQYNDRDLAYALRSFSKVITDGATEDTQNEARFAQAIAGPGREGRKAFYAKLTELATPETLEAARAAWTESLVKSDAMRADRKTEANRQAALTAALYGTDEDSNPDHDDFTEAGEGED